MLRNVSCSDRRHADHRADRTQRRRENHDASALSWGCCRSTAAHHPRRRAISPLPAHHRARAGIGYAPEDRRLLPKCCVEENILLPALALKLDGLKANAGSTKSTPCCQNCMRCGKDREEALRRAGQDGRAWPGSHGGTRRCCSTSRSRGSRRRWRCYTRTRCAAAPQPARARPADYRVDPRNCSTRLSIAR